MTEQTYYRWRKAYGGMGLEPLRELKRLEKENERLRRAVATQRLRACGKPVSVERPRSGNKEATMRFLTGSEIQQEVRNIMSRPGEVMAAVAYWGIHGEERTGLDRKENPQSARIICNLDHVACNPFAIEDLLTRWLCVKTLPRLHAKVWMSGDDVVLGSANASGRALPTDPHDGRANVEAAFVAHGQGLAQEVRD